MKRRSIATLVLAVGIIVCAVCAMTGASFSPNHPFWNAFGVILPFCGIAAIIERPTLKDAPGPRDASPIPDDLNAVPASMTRMDPWRIRASGLPYSGLTDPDKDAVLKYSSEKNQKIFIIECCLPKQNLLVPCIVVVTNDKPFVTLSREEAERPGADHTEWNDRRKILAAMLRLS